MFAIPAVQFVGGFLRPGTVTGNVVSKSGHGRKGMHIGWMAQGRRTFVGVTGWWVANGEGGGRASIWLNRNGRGDIFKPGKVWCLALTRGALGVPRISLHYLTI